MMDQDDQLDRLFAASIAAHKCPSNEQLAAYTMGMLKGTDHLTVRAHVLRCPFCAQKTELYSDLEQEPDVSREAPVPRMKRALAQLVSFPLLPQRSPIYRDAGDEDEDVPLTLDADKKHVRAYRVADITITITIVPLANRRWRITGQVKQADLALPERTVVMTAHREPTVVKTARRWRSQQTTDDQGYFTFEPIPAGRYTLSVTEAGVQVQIRDLILGDSSSS